MKIPAMQTVVVYFVGGGSTTITATNAKTLASNLQNNEWVDLGDRFIQSKNVTQYKIVELGGVEIIDDIPKA